jgi:hypothetical protein
MAAKRHPTEGAVLERFPVAHEIGGFIWKRFMRQGFYAARLLCGKALCGKALCGKALCCKALCCKA